MQARWARTASAGGTMSTSVRRARARRRAVAIAGGALLLGLAPAALAESGRPEPAGSPAAVAEAPTPERGQPAPQAASSGTGDTPSAAAATTTPGGIEVTDLGSTSSDALAQQLVGSGVTISSVTYTGTPDSAGTFAAGLGAVGFDAGIVLGSGSVETHDGDESCSKGVEGPNECTGNTTSLGSAGDSDLTTLAGLATHDATVLEFDFVPNFDTISFDYVFSSDEYREFANSSFNDVFGFLVNGTNCAVVPGTTDPVSVNTINTGNPNGDTTEHNATFYVDNPQSAPSRDLEMDGLTVVLPCAATVNPGVVNHMKLAIADGSDSALDSNVFIRKGSFNSGPVCAEDGLATYHLGAALGVASNTVHLLEPTVTGLLGADAGKLVHDLNCAEVVPIEDLADSLLVPILGN
jgi:hypothetical protein